MRYASRLQHLAASGLAGALAAALGASPVTAQQKGWTTAVAPVQETGALPTAPPSQAAPSPWQPVTSSDALDAANELARQIAAKSNKRAPRLAATTPAQAPPPAAKAPQPQAAPRSAAAQGTAPHVAPADIEAAAAEAQEAAQQSAKAEPKGDAELNLAEKYCVNIADSALDARYSLQKKSLIELQQQLEKRIELLQTKTAEYQKWVARRDEFSNKANDNLVKIYAKMQPDAAAAQLGAMDEETAAALLVKLDPRNASVILNEMPAAKAAALTAMISGAAKVPPNQASSTPAGEKKS